MSLAARGWVEPVQPSPRSVNVFVHQALARVLQHSGVSRGRLVAGVGAPFCFEALEGGERAEIVEHLISRDMLMPADGLLTFGEQGEKRLGRANFLELYSVFETPRELTVRTTTNKVVGTLGAWFAQALDAEAFVFVLGGRPWQAVECDWDRGIITVQPAPKGKVPTWMGSPRLLSREVCEAVRGLLVDGAAVPFLSPPAHAVLDRLREQWRDVLAPARLVIQRKGNDVFLHTFAGGRINNVLARVLHRECGVEAHIDNFWLRMRHPDQGPFMAPFLRALDAAREDGYFTAAVVEEMVSGLSRARLSKFQDLLPAHLESRYLAGRLLDLDGAHELTHGSVYAIQG